MKLLIVTPHFWPENLPINKWATKIVNKGHQVQVLTGKPNYPNGEVFSKYKKKKNSLDQYNYKKIKIISLPIIPRKKGTSINLALNYISFVFSFIIYLPKLINLLKFDRILYYGISPLTAAIPAIILKKIKKKKLVFWIQDLWPESISFTGHVKNLFLIKIINYFCIKIYNSADIILCQSASFAKHLKNKKVKPKIKILYNSYDLNKNLYKVKINKKIKKILSNNFCITYGGNIGKAQYFENILSIAKQIQKYKIKFLIFGSGSDYFNIKKKIKNYKINNIYLYPQIKEDLINKIYTKSSVLLLTLNKNSFLSKTIPSKLQNYLAIGKPILISADGEVNKLIKKNKCGLVSPAEDYKILKKNIFKLFKSRNNNQKYKLNAINLYNKKFNLNKNINTMINYL